MSAGWIVALELIGVLGVLVGFAGWDLYSLRRDRKRKDE
ncbi:conserved hypothetical protein [Burkholderiales bacterium 8X]|nr:conserved hypothetical protein [Burkholderiales bacterium 8X]